MSPTTARANTFNLWSRALLSLTLALVLSAVFWPTPAEDCTNPDSSCSVFGMGERRAQNAQLERIGGKSAVYAVQFNQWLSGWRRAPKLLWLLAAITALGAWLCRREARFLRDLRQHAPNAPAPPASPQPPQDADLL